MPTSDAPADPLEPPGRAREQSTDVVVIGAGFGGLGAAVELARRGLRVVVCEALTYPGGCAGTFRRGGCAFDAGATLAAGFAPGQLFRRWQDELGLRVETSALDPVVEFRAGGFILHAHADRARFEAALCALPGAPVEGLRAFLAEQRRTADTMWRLLDDTESLPPLGLRALLRHASRAPQFLRVARWAGRPLIDVLRHHGVADFRPLRTFADAVSQITVQCGSAEAEAPAALATFDYFWRGARHVRGGMGALARGVAECAATHGADVRYATRVVRVEPRDGRWIVTTNRGVLEARSVVANLLPGALERIAGREFPSLRRLAADVETGWGAAMLYRVLRDEGLPSGPKHLQLVADASEPFVEGNHVFVSISSAEDPGRAPAGHRTATISTHVLLAKLLAMSDSERAASIAAVQERMRRTIELRAPELRGRVATEHPASPRTFERFTGRDGGWVGGVPKRAGLRNFRGLGPVEPHPGLFLVGDSAFPGQSAMAAAIGGTRAAEAVARGA